jgi:hypothetical protein
MGIAHTSAVAPSKASRMSRVASERVDANAARFMRAPLGLPGST